MLVALMCCVAMRGAGAPVDTAYFVNIGPGPEIYELDGHSALVFADDHGRLMAYNYGTFDFNAPNFVWRFVKGETDYMCAAVPWEYFAYAYAGTGRGMEAVTVPLDSVQARRLRDLLAHDSSPEYRTYRYNYVLDNCATRPLRALELALGDSIILTPAPIEADSYTPMTFRSVMRRNHRNYPWYQFGIDLALGSGIDRPITRREAAFAPEELMEMLPEATIGGHRLSSECIVMQEPIPGMATAGPTPWYLTPMAAACAVMAMAIFLTFRDVRRYRRCRTSGSPATCRPTTRWFDSAMFGIYGLAGLLLTFLIFVSVHEATSPNWLYAWLNPFCLIAAVGIWINRARRVVYCYYFINFAAVTALLVAWYRIPQSANPAFAPLIAADLMRTACYLYVNKRNIKATPQ